MVPAHLDSDLNATTTRISPLVIKRLIAVWVKIIDNFGDFGVAYRLAKILSKQGNMVVLYVKPKIPTEFVLNHDPKTLIIYEEEEGFNFNYLFDFVITTFSSRPPLEINTVSPKKLVNVDYLEWYEGCGDKEYSSRIDFPPSKQDGFITSDNIESIELDTDRYNLTWFSYMSDMPIGLKKKLNSLNKKVYVHTTHDISLEGYNNLELIKEPFKSQEDFDNTLRKCHINFVRGEDSFIRSLLSGNLTLWHPYSNARISYSGFLREYSASWPKDLSQAVIKLMDNFLCNSKHEEDYHFLDVLLDNFDVIRNLTLDFKKSILAKPCVTKRLEKYFESL